MSSQSDEKAKTPDGHTVANPEDNRDDHPAEPIQPTPNHLDSLPLRDRRGGQLKEGGMNRCFCAEPTHYRL